MSNNSYHLVSHWRVEGTVEEVSAVLKNPLDLVRWWPAVYLRVTELEPGDEHGVGRRVSLLTKGWLPYSLRWQFRVTESREPFGFALEASGDLMGHGVWTFEQDGRWVNLRYDWAVRADKPLLRVLSFVLWPVFAANHRWAMRQGERSLRLELAHRHSAMAGDPADIPPPPGPISPLAPWLWTGAFAVLGWGLIYWVKG